MKNLKPPFLMFAVAGMALVLGSSKAMAWFDNYGRLVPCSDVAEAFNSYDQSLAGWRAGWCSARTGK